MRLFRRLAPGQRESLLSYAEFLSTQSTQAGPVEAMPLAAPADIPRPDSETVIAAIRRLSQTFHMLDKDTVLHETSELMTSHVMHGRPADKVIDELEIVFRRHYERVKSSLS